MGILISTVSAALIAVSSVIYPSPSAIPFDRTESQDTFTIRLQSSEDIRPFEKKTAPPTPSPVVYSPPPASLTEAQLNFLGNCESGMTAERNSGNGYYGAFQFSIGTWNSMGTGYDRADLAPLEVQKDAVQRLVARSSIFTQFPGCSSEMRAQGLL